MFGYGIHLSRCVLYHVQHPVYVVSIYAMIYELEYVQGMSVSRSCSAHPYMYCFTCTHSIVWSYTLLCFIVLHVGITMFMDVTTWAEQQPNLQTLLKIKFNQCDVSKWHHKLLLDKLSGPPSTHPLHGRVMIQCSRCMRKTPIKYQKKKCPNWDW